MASDLLLAKHLGVCVLLWSSLLVLHAESAVSRPVQRHQSGLELKDCIFMHASYSAEQLYYCAAFGEGGVGTLNRARCHQHGDDS